MAHSKRMARRTRRIGKENGRVLDQFSRTCAISLHSPKTSALIFEKVISTLDGIADAPLDVVTHRRGGDLQSLPTTSGGGPEPEQRTVNLKVRDGVVITGCPPENLQYLLETDPSPLLKAVLGADLRPVLCYPKADDDAEVFKPGDNSFILTCIRNLGVVDEEALAWEQVAEFREDRQSRAELIRFHFWLNTVMGMKSKAEIQAHIGDLYEKRRSALRKFGIVTRVFGDSVVAIGSEAMGRMMVGAAALGGGYVALETSPLWGALAGGLVIGSTVAAQVSKARAALKIERDATAFIHGLATRFGDKSPTKGE